MRVFLDTNVLVSAFTARGLCADLFRLLLSEHELATGEVNLTELRRVPARHFHASDAQLTNVEAQLRDQVIVPRPAAPSTLPIRDPDDGWVLASAIAGEADLLVTGDKDLLVVRSEAPLEILTPREAWERLRTVA